MRTVICADAHLDGLFPLFANDPIRSAQRREEAQDTFGRVIRKVQDTHAHVLLLPGDLFDADRVTEDTIAFLQECFCSVPDTYVFISPGNNDPATADSYYRTATWPENVYIFQGDLEAVEIYIDETAETVRVYGAGFRNRTVRKPFLSADRIPALDASCVNILLMHTSLDRLHACNPVSVGLLDRCGFDFCAFGHDHTCSGVVATENTFYAFPGACEERRFPPQAQTQAEDAEEPEPIPTYGSIRRGGIFYGTISKKRNNLTFEDISARHHICGELDITGIPDENTLYAAVMTRFPINRDLYRVTLTGMRDPALRIRLKRLNALLQRNYFYMRIFARFRNPRDAAAVQDPAQRAFLKEALRAAADGTDDALLEQSIYYGLTALEDPASFDAEEVSMDV